MPRKKKPAAQERGVVGATEASFGRGEGGEKGLQVGKRKWSVKIAITNAATGLSNSGEEISHSQAGIGWDAGAASIPGPAESAIDLAAGAQDLQWRLLWMRL